MATTTKPLLSAEEFLRDHADNGAYELVRGEVVDVSPSMPEHGVVCANIAYLLGSYGRQTGRGFALSNDAAVVTGRNPDTVRGADVAFYSHARLPRDQVGSKPAPVAPDLVVEVFSPGNRRAEILGKVQEYLEAGVAAVWLVHPARKTVHIFRVEDPVPVSYGISETLEDLPELPGFRVAVADFFA